MPFKQSIAKPESSEIAIKPDFASAHNNLGSSFRESGKLKNAVKCHENAIAINPNFAEAHNNLGNALKDSGDIDEAVESFHKAITLKPDYVEAFYNLLASWGKLVALQVPCSVTQLRPATTQTAFPLKQGMLLVVMKTATSREGLLKHALLAPAYIRTLNTGFLRKLGFR